MLVAIFRMYFPTEFVEVCMNSVTFRRNLLISHSRKNINYVSLEIIF